jgi:hypothetical protein
MPPVSRRSFIKTLGTTALLSPFMGARAWANDAAPLRLVVFFSPNGTIHQHWRPTGGENSFSFQPGSILEPLESIRDDVLILDGINFLTATNHEGGMGAMLTGGGASGETGGKSLDQYIASQLAPPTRFASLELGVQTSNWGGGMQTRMSYSGPGSYVTPDDRPANVFERLFGDVSQDAQALEKLRTRRLSVLDLVRSETAALKPKLGMRERIKLDEHLEAIRRLELSFQDNSSQDCSTPALNAISGPTSNASFPLVGQAQMDLLVTSLACDMTRVASLQWSHTVSPTVFTWLGLNEGHHALSHCDDNNTAGVASFVQAERWYAEQFVNLVESLRQRSDPLGPGSLLDNTVVLWAKEMGDSRLHNCESVPFVIAGGSASPFGLGRYLQLNNTAHNHLLVSVCEAFGLSNQTFGDPSVGSGSISELFG